MKSFRLLSLAIAAFACAAAVSSRAVDAVASVYRAGKALFFGHFDAAVQAFAKPEHLPAPAVKFVSAVAFVLRQTKRERPTVTPRWRMCPSA